MTFQGLVVLFASDLPNVQLAGQNSAGSENEIKKACAQKETTTLAQAWCNVSKYFGDNQEVEKNSQAPQTKKYIQYYWLKPARLRRAGTKIELKVPLSLIRNQ